MASPPAALLAAVVGRRGAARANGTSKSNGAAKSRSAAKSNGVASGLRLVDTVDRGDRLPARLRLLEGLLSRTQIADCAQLALQWFGEVLRLRESICLVRTGGEPSLSMVASYGLPHAAASAFSLSLDDWSSPLVGALLNRTHIHYGAAHSALDRRRRPSTPFEDAAFHVVPLGVSGFSGEAVGLLLFAGASPLGPEQQWFTSVFGQKLDQILRQQALAEGDRKQGRERSLLYSIINAVTDPILLTDTEGRLLIANARAHAVHRVGGRERRPARRRAHEQHAAVVGALEQGDRGNRRGAGASCCWSTRSTDRTCSSSCSARSPKIRARAPASSRFCATSPTCAARARRSKRTTASCASPRCRRAPRATA